MPNKKGGEVLWIIQSDNQKPGRKREEELPPLLAKSSTDHLYSRSFHCVEKSAKSNGKIMPIKLGKCRVLGLYDEHVKSIIVNY